MTDLRRQLEQKVARLAEETAREVENNLKRSAPVESGDLQDSISATARKLPSGSQQIDLEIGVPWAWRMRREWEEQLRRLPDTMARIWGRIP